MIVTTVLNQKGGVGKTSTTFHLAGVMARPGCRVLVIDNDPQASITQILFGAAVAETIDPDDSVAAIYAEEAHPERVIRPSGFENFDIIPGSERAMLANVPDLESLDESRSRVLADFLDYVRDRYDYVFIDCPSNLQFLSYAALVASDQILIPIVPEDLGAQGYFGVRKLVSRVQAGPNPGLHVVGILLTMVTKKAVHVVFERELREMYGAAVFERSIPSAAPFVDAIALGLPINHHKPSSVYSSKMGDLAVELMHRSASQATKTDPVEELV